MMERGARNFAFISRSGVRKAEPSRLVKSLIEAGANVQVFQADAANEEDVARIVAEVNTKIPIRGVVHAAMVLQVCFLVVQKNFSFIFWYRTGNLMLIWSGCNIRANDDAREIHCCHRA